MLIPLGCHCNITCLQQDAGIKRETGLFEYLQSDKLQYITDVVNSLKSGIDTSIIQGSNRDLYLINKKIFTYHYDLEEYKEIFTRRATRFLDQIRNQKELIFARINAYKSPEDEILFTTEEEINNFADAIHSINPALKIKFLLIHTTDDEGNYTQLDETKIHDIIFVQKKFEKKDCPDYYLKQNGKIQTLFLEYLSGLGYDVNEKNYVEFSDRH
jgi:hypothetical protein